MMQSEIEEANAHTAHMLMLNRKIHEGRIRELGLCSEIEMSKSHLNFGQPYLEWCKSVKPICINFNMGLKLEMDENRDTIVLINAMQLFQEADVRATQLLMLNADIHVGKIREVELSVEKELVRATVKASFDGVLRQQSNINCADIARTNAVECTMIGSSAARVAENTNKMSPTMIIILLAAVGAMVAGCYCM